MPIVFLAIFVASALMAPQVAPAQGIRVYIDGRLVNFDVPPTIIQGRVLVPLRGIFEQMGATVDYDARTQHIVALRSSQSVELTVGSRQAQVNGAPHLLDVPAFTINGRTMVPLRFISESLGANVQWVEANQTILIGSSSASGPPPAPSPAPQPETISGVLVAVNSGQNSSITVHSRNGQNTTIAVTPATAIYRYNADTRAGGSAALTTLRRGDRVVVEMNDQKQATKITAAYRAGSAARIAHVVADSRTVTTSDGHSYVVLADAMITLNGQPSDFSAIQVGRIARFVVIEGTNQAYQVNVATPSSTSPPPTALSAPTITAPANGSKVPQAFIVQGQSQPGSTVVVNAQPRLFGNAKSAQTTAQANGTWQVAMNLQSFPFVSFPYVISAVAIMNGVQSDPSSVEVTVQ